MRQAVAIGWRLLAFLLVLTATAAHAGDTSVIERKLTDFNPTPDYCRIDPEASEWERDRFDARFEFDSYTDKLLAYYVRCDRKGDLMAAPDDTWILPALYVSHIEIYEEFGFEEGSREAFVAKFYDKFEGSVPGNRLDAVPAAAFERYIAPKFAELVNAKIPAKLLGSVYRDDSAMYFLAIGLPEGEGPRTNIVSLMAMTLVGGRAIKLHLKEPYSDVGGIIQALEHLKRYTALLTSGTAR